MEPELKKIEKFRYLEKGEGTPIIILHGLMGGLSNFEGVHSYFPEHGYKVLIPELPVYELPLIKTKVSTFAIYLKDFIDELGYASKEVLLLGNSLGGHIALLCTKMFPERVKGLVITGSSGLYEKGMGESYPKRGDYQYIKEKAENVFYDPTIATKEIVDDVYATVNNRNKLIRTLAIAKSAIRHNMAKDLPKMNIPTCIIWGKNDNVTPPEVANDFHRLLPDSNLYWIDNCGHAAMMEHPNTFNKVLHDWLQLKNL